MSPIRMRLLSLASVVLAFALSAALGVAPAHGSGSPHSIPGFSYVSPAPDSKLLRPENNIIVRPGGQVDPVSLTASTITVTGTLSGDHPGTLRLSENGATILFRPATPFSYGESVTCTIAPGIHATPGGELPGASFTFQVAPPPAPASLAAGGGGLAALLGDIEAATVVPAPARSPAARTDSIGMPSYELSVTGTTAPGALFVSDFRFDDPLYPSHLLILRNDGTAAFQKPLANQGLDFKLQPDHRRVTYFDGDRGYYYVMNANGAVIDSLQPGNGYPIDLHELVLLPNGHALLMSYDPQPLDMSTVVEGGNPNAVVVGLVIQELDQEKDVVFQWRSWDHFQITDCVRSITGANVDYAHGNSIEPDTDGNLIFSSRHMDEITKVSRETGEIIWRLGGKNNQFTFVNDPDQFSQQHSARRLANGHLLLYDNGNFHTPPRSRAVEYTLDEVHRVATLVWQYRNTPDTFGGAMGSVQRLPNGNTLIGWGATNPTATEVAPDGRKVAEMTFAPGTFSYRAFRFEWPPVVPVATRPSLETIDVETKDQTVTVVLSSDVFEGEEIDLTSIRLAGAVSPISHHVPSEPVPIRPWRGGRPGVLSIVPDMAFTFSVESLLPYLRNGTQELTLTGALTTGESITGSVTLTVEGERSTRARWVSPVGAFPIRLAVRATGAPRPVVFQAYDVHGRRVARWTATTDASGVVTWDGRAGDGERLRSGIYFVGTEGSVLTERTKVVLVK